MPDRPHHRGPAWHLQSSRPHNAARRFVYVVVVVARDGGEYTLEAQGINESDARSTAWATLTKAGVECREVLSSVFARRL